MRQTYEATIDQKGNVQLLEPVKLSKTRRALVTILDDESDVSETAMLSEAALAEDWNRREEDAAWSHLQPEQFKSNPPESVVCPHSPHPNGARR